MEEENKLTEQESLDLIARTINQAKSSYHDTGIGPILWGGVITFCSLVTYGEQQFKLAFPFDVWLLTLIALLPQLYINVKEKKSRKVKRYEDITMSYIWTCFGISIFLFVHINAVLSIHLQPILTEHGVDFNLASYSSAVFLLLYGFPSLLTGGIMKFRPMTYGGILCWVCCIISVYTDIKADMLLTALSATAMWLIPGIILFRINRMRQKTANV